MKRLVMLGVLVLALVAARLLTATNEGYVIPLPPRETPYVVTSGSMPKGIASGSWDLIAYERVEIRPGDSIAKSELCISVVGAPVEGEGPACLPAELVEEYLPRLKLAPRADFGRQATWVYGWTSEIVARVRIEPGETDPVVVETIKLPGSLLRVFVVAFPPEMPDVPVVSALDAASTVVARYQGPSGPYPVSGWRGKPPEGRG